VSADTNTHINAELAGLVARYTDVDATLTSTGSPFEVRREDVGGESMLVYANRPTSLGGILAAATRYGDRACFIFDDGSQLSFTDVVRDARRVAAGLADRGIGRGDRVAICAPNRLEWLLTFWAATSMGAVVVAMNGWWTGTEMMNALELTEPKLLIADRKRLERLAADTQTPTIDMDEDFVSLYGTASTEEAMPTIDEDEPAMLLFTSGTTGRPKAAALSHRNVVAFVMSQDFIAARGMALAGRTAAGPPPTRLAVFPLFHVSGMSATVACMLNGATTVWPLGRFDPGRVIELTKQHGIRSWGGTVTHILRLLDHPDIATVDPQTLAQVGIGGSATTPEVIRRTEAAFPHLTGTFSTGYGSTESGGLISYASNAMIRLVPECVGPVLPTIEVRIVDDDGNDLPDGEEGNICCRSPLVMMEYWRNRQANAEVFLDHRWLRTGDFGRMDGGALFLASRRRDLILRGGENVYPFEIENRLDEHPDIEEVAVIGIDHDILGQEIGAVVVVRQGSMLTVEAVQRWCAETLASYKVPAHVEIRTTALPRNPTGKVMKHLLGDQPAEASANLFVDE
jgi:long-chain acyl-CoA synthetase